MSLADLNKLAEAKFKNIKEKHFGKPLIQKAIEVQDRFNFIDNKEELTKEDFERPMPEVVLRNRIIPEESNKKVMNYTNIGMTQLKENEKEEITVGSILDFVSSLSITNNLKLAICNLISLDSKQGKEFSELLMTTYNLIDEERIHSK